jgi:hypothetical protein
MKVIDDLIQALQEFQASVAAEAEPKTIEATVYLRSKTHEFVGQPVTLVSLGDYAWTNTTKAEWYVAGRHEIIGCRFVCAEWSLWLRPSRPVSTTVENEVCSYLPGALEVSMVIDE